MTWSALSSLVYEWDLAAGGFFVHRNGVVPPYEYAEAYQDMGVLRHRLVHAKLEHLLAQGATLTLNRIDQKSAAIDKLCGDLAHVTEEKIEANGYMAFGDASTSGKYWGIHGAFVVQLLGKKLWKVYQPTFLWPFPHQHNRDYKVETPPSPVFEKVLEPGDVLYLPRGWGYEASSISDTPTFHIAAGIHAGSAMDHVQ